MQEKQQYDQAPFGTPAGEPKPITKFTDADMARLSAVSKFNEARATSSRIGAMMGAGEEWARIKGGRNEQLSDELTSAPALLARAKQHMDERAATYDQPAGERSMAATVAMFNIATSRDLSESEGWLLMQCLKMVRDRSRKQPHVDSIEDNVSYAALYGEARLAEVQS